MLGDKYLHFQLEGLYKILKRYPNYHVTVYWTGKKETLHIRASYTCSNSLPGIDTDETKSSFTVSRSQTIDIEIPHEYVESAKVDTILAEIEWAFEELKRFSELSQDGSEES